MFSSGPSLELMTAKFGSPVSPPSPTDTCSSTVNDALNSGHAAPIHNKPPLNFNRRALYSMTYEEAAINLHQVQCTAFSMGRSTVVLPGPEDMLKGAPAYQAEAPTPLPTSSLSPIEQTHSPLPHHPHRRRGRRHLTTESRIPLTSTAHSNLQSPRQRVSIACTFCRARKLRCTPGPPPCEHCKRRSHPCKFDYQPQHRDQLPSIGSSYSSSRDHITHIGKE